MSESKLPPLPGTAPDGSWRIANIDRDEFDGRLAICAIVARSSAAPLSLRGAGDGTLIGTGFYLLPNGGFATAKHVALEALEAMSRSENSVGLVYALTNGLLVFRPIWSFAVHPTADLAFGVPHEIFDNKTGNVFRAKVLSLECAAPAIGSPISTWAYPLHAKRPQPNGTELLHIQPAFYDGTLQEIYKDRGPSSRLTPPYYLTNIHLHGGSSGGPVFNESGHVFGVASCSYDGAEDVAFVTPIDPIFDIEVQNVDLGDGIGLRTVTVRDIGNGGRIVIQFR
ncbi:trypsin-like peptidase domain-containing protein [Bradyrhizobium rifense]|uniref:Trypsin-like peptidase domain-containing protein n=1 Tax=Bradyrhizobium rifense TaxID=515499 RepID=A0A5D3KG82_9BRAD|nr:serine protease [Bradyrhizobium rifense]TYL89969.1 trypsin-like peptidase domain-containing protein [Bradyrhizobium rifense]